MEKRVLFTELDDRGSHLRKEITPTAVVTDKRRFPTAQFWDANKTYDVIVADATSASDTLEKAEKNLNNEIARAQAEEAKLRADSVHSATYSDGTISFKNINNEVVNTLSAAPFIKDGMVSGVEIIDDVLVVSFNTDAGIDNIEIPLEDIFDPDNYYTKTQINNMIGDIESLLSNI